MRALRKLGAMLRLRQRVRVSFRVPALTRAKLRALRRQGYDLSLGLESAVDGWFHDLYEEEEA